MLEVKLTSSKFGSTQVRVVLVRCSSKILTLSKRVGSGSNLAKGMMSAWIITRLYCSCSSFEVTVIVLIWGPKPLGCHSTLIVLPSPGSNSMRSSSVVVQPQLALTRSKTSLDLPVFLNSNSPVKVSVSQTLPKLSCERVNVRRGPSPAGPS